MGVSVKFKYLALGNGEVMITKKDDYITGS